VIKFLQAEKGKNRDVYRDDKFLIHLKMESNTISNKFDIIANYIGEISNFSPDFDEWFESFLCEYIFAEQARYLVLEKHINTIKKYSDDYITSKNIDFSKFSDITKTKKNSIFFQGYEIENIIRSSCYLKLYAVISNSDNLRLDYRLHKKAYNEFLKDIGEELIAKIYMIVQTKTFKYNQTDRYMWEHIKVLKCKSIDTHAIEIFNTIMNNIIVLCSIDMNPIIYFTTIVDESIKWTLKTAYEAKIIYDDSISTEDIHGPGSDNLKTYAYNDTLGRLKAIAYKQIYETVEKTSLSLNPEKSDHLFTIIHQRIKNASYISPFCDFLVYPIISKITQIPYDNFRALTPEHAIVLSVYLQNLIRKVFEHEYKILFKMLSYYPTSQPSLQTTYKLKNMSLFITLANSVDDFFGFKSKVLLANMIGTFVGKVARVNFVDVFTGEELNGIPVSKLETEMIQFYVLLFSNKLDDYISKIREEMLRDF